MYSYLISLSEYNTWANKRIVDATKIIDQTLLDKSVKSSFNSISSTLLHIWNAQSIWLDRLKGIKPSIIPSDQYNQVFRGNEAYFIQQSEDLEHYVLNLNEEKLTLDCIYFDRKNNEFKHPYSDLILHCLNHSTYHRGQVISIMRLLDINNPPSTDYLLYINQ